MHKPGMRSELSIGDMDADDLSRLARAIELETEGSRVKLSEMALAIAKMGEPLLAIDQHTREVLTSSIGPAILDSNAKIFDFANDFLALGAPAEWLRSTSDEWFKGFEVLDGLDRYIRETWQFNLEPLFTGLSTFATAFDAFLPPNVRAHAGELQALGELAYVESFPVAYVPSERTLGDLLAAPNRGARRRIIANRRRGLLNEAQVVLDGLRAPELRKHSRFAQRALDAARADHPEAAQALSANTIDSVLSEVFEKRQLEHLKGQNNPIALDECALAEFILVAQLRGIHRTYRPSSGDAIPSDFNRHGAVHGVSPRQYNKVNAVLAVLHVVSLLAILDSLATPGSNS